MINHNFFIKKKYVECLGNHSRGNILIFQMEFSGMQFK